MEKRRWIITKIYQKLVTTPLYVSNVTTVGVHPYHLHAETNDGVY